MNHIYFTSLVDGAGFAAEIAAELSKSDAIPRVYAVAPTGAFENDPNVTDKKFPGSPTRSYRSSAPLRIVSKITEWTRLTPEQLQTWRERLTALLSSERGEILNWDAEARPWTPRPDNHHFGDVSVQMGWLISSATPSPDCRAP